MSTVVWCETGFGSCNAVMLLGGIGYIGTMYIVSLFYQDGLGLSAAQAGLSILPVSLGVMTGSQIIAKVLYPVIGPRRILCAVLVLNAAMMAAMTTVGPATSLWWPRTILFILGMGMSGVYVSVQTAAFAATSHRDMGAATTLLSMQQQLGGAIGVAIMTTVLVAADPVTMTAGHPAPNLAAYRVAFAVGGAFALTGAAVAILIRDADAASTITRWRKPTKELGGPA